MLPNEHYENDQVWNRLQEPARPGKFPPALLLLLAALDTGWQVLEPVRQGPGWQVEGEPVYHFLLLRAPSTGIRLLTVPAGPEVARFLNEEGLKITGGSLAFCTGLSLHLS
jgi:hypothetical protein